MPVEILMPKLGLTMTEGKIVEWCNNEGDQVKAGEILFVLETEKVVHEVESPEEGILGRILVAQDDTAPVGAVVALLLKPGETADSLPDGPPAAAAQPAEEPVTPSEQTAAPAQAQSSGGRVRATPLAKKLAREVGADLSSISGTGPSGRIVAQDVRNAGAASPAAPKPVDAPVERLVPLTGMRRAIANNMMAAKMETAQTYMSLSADASAIVKYRVDLLPHIEQKFGVKLTVTDLMMKVTGAAIKEHEVINTRWTDQGIQYLSTVHMGMAMAVDDGLLVPVIRDINQKDLGEIAQDRTAVIKKIRDKNFSPDDIKGSTFTLSTLGMFGVEWFTANINHPESAILAVGAIVEKPVVVDGEVTVRPMMTVTLTYDHRIIDGADAAKFMRTLKSYIEDPIRLLI